MEREFWKESASSLRESVTERKSENKERINKTSYKKSYKESYEQKDSLKPLRMLENAYGKYVFGTKNDKYAIMVYFGFCEYSMLIPAFACDEFLR